MRVHGIVRAFPLTLGDGHTCMPPYIRKRDPAISMPSCGRLNPLFSLESHACAERRGEIVILYANGHRHTFCHRRDVKTLSKSARLLEGSINFHISLFGCSARTRSAKRKSSSDRL